MKRPNLVPKFDKVLSAAAEKGRREGRTPGDTIYRSPGGGGHDCDVMVVVAMIVMILIVMMVMLNDDQ